MAYKNVYIVYKLYNCSFLYTAAAAPSFSIGFSSDYCVVCVCVYVHTSIDKSGFALLCLGDAGIRNAIEFRSGSSASLYLFSSVRARDDNVKAKIKQLVNTTRLFLSSFLFLFVSVYRGILYIRHHR